jgi:hypothetical protein
MKTSKERRREIVRKYYYNKGKTSILASNRKWRRANPDKVKAQQRRYKARHPNASNEYNLQRRKRDIGFRLQACLRTRIYHALKGHCKSCSTMQLLGCSIGNFWIYLESKFQPGMTRENYGTVWHIDHIMPCSIFDLSKPAHQKRCFHFSNMQPLFRQENRKKGKLILSNQFQLI